MPSEVVSQLLPGERIAWEGAPAQGIRLRIVDLPMAIFGGLFALIGGVFAIAAFPFGLLIPHLWVGLYFAFGHFLVDAKLRRNTAYALTQSRGIIVRRWPRYRATTINLKTIPEINVQRHRDGTGTISFGPSWNRFARQASFTHHVPAFEYIEDPDRVAQLVHAASLGLS